MRFFRFLKPKKPRRTFLRPHGQHYNLQEIYDFLNAKYFDSKLNLAISWFGTGKTIPRTRILFGSFCHQRKLIKVNRLLDHHSFPEHFVHFIVYHEMLHEVHPPFRKKNGRRSIHHAAFKEGEKKFTHYAAAQNFIKSWRRAPIHINSFHQE